MSDQAIPVSEPQVQGELHSTTPPTTPEPEITIKITGFNDPDHPDRTIPVSKSLLIKHEYFRASLNPHYESATTNELILDGKEHNSNHIARIIAWIKGDRSMLLFTPDPSRNHDQQVRRKQEVLAGIYIQADKFLLYQLQDEIVDAIRKFSTTALPSLDAWCALRNQISSECGLARYLLDNLVFCLIVNPEARRASPDGWHLYARSSFKREEELESLVDCKIREREAEPMGDHFAPGGTFEDMC